MLLEDMSLWYSLNKRIYDKEKEDDLTIILFFVEIVGVEPTTSCLQSRRSSQLSYTPMLVVPSRLELLTPTLSV